MYRLEILFFIAFLLYSLVIWIHRFKKEFQMWMVWTFFIAFAADISGTVFLCMAATHGWTLSLHTLTGFFSLFVMALHFIWMVMAVMRAGKYEECFYQYSIWAWGVWFVAFISGIIL